MKTRKAPSTRKIILGKFNGCDILIAEKSTATHYYFISGNLRSQQFTDLTEALKAHLRDNINYVGVT